MKPTRVAHRGSNRAPRHRTPQRPRRVVPRARSAGVEPWSRDGPRAIEDPVVGFVVPGDDVESTFGDLEAVVVGGFAMCHEAERVRPVIVGSRGCPVVVMPMLIVGLEEATAVGVVHGDRPDRRRPSSPPPRRPGRGRLSLRLARGRRRGWREPRSLRRRAGLQDDGTTVQEHERDLVEGVDVGPEDSVVAGLEEVNSTRRSPHREALQVSAPGSRIRWASNSSVSLSGSAWRTGWCASSTTSRW